MKFYSDPFTSILSHPVMSIDMSLSPIPLEQPPLFEDRYDTYLFGCTLTPISNEKNKLK
jgi:hypothetical protein